MFLSKDVYKRQVYTLTIHFVTQPFTTVVALVSPCICTLTLSVSVAELALVDVPICEDVET